MKNTGTKDNVVKQNRIGRFTVSKAMIEEAPDKLLRSFFGRFIIARAEFIYHSSTFDYIAYSEYFNKCNPQQKIPLYDLTITEKKGQIINLKTTIHGE